MRLTMPTKRSRLRNARAAALLIVLLAATLAIGAIPAGAGQTRTATDATVSVSGSTIFYRAAPTQVNHLVIRDNGTASGFIGFAISDTGATIRPGPGCSSSGSTSALCNVPINTLPAYDVDLGDQNDTFDVLVNFAQPVQTPRLPHEQFRLSLHRRNHVRPHSSFGQSSDAHFF